MTGLIGRKLLEVIMRRLSSAPASIDPPPLRIGSVSGGYAARALARYAALHSAERPPHMGACANTRSVRVPAIVPDQKTKAAKRKQQVRVSLKTIFLLSFGFARV